MHMILIAIIFVFNFSNAQLLKLDTIAPSYNDWLSLRQKDTSIAELFLNTHIAAQFDNMQLIKDRMNHNNSLTNQNSTNDNGQHKINGYFSIPPDGTSHQEIRDRVVEWIDHRSNLWHLPMSKLCLYARLDIYGDFYTKQWLHEIIQNQLIDFANP